ncbi:type VII secretion integral membrane protein EccD, partial [Spirillospora sp. NPDC049652]
SAVGGMVFLATAPGWAPAATIGAMSVSLLLRSRVFRGVTQRSWMLVAGFTGLGLLEIGTAWRGDSQLVMLATGVLPLLIVVGVVVGVSIWLPNHRPSPFWGRAGDILDVIVVISLIPLALAALDVYGRIRGLAG